MIKQTTYPIAQLVSSPDTFAEIYFDFNDESNYPDHDTFKFEPPQLLGEPGGIGAEYDYRTVSFDLVIPGDEDDIMRQHSRLAKQLTRDTMYFRFQMSQNASPVWFKCVRSSPGETSIADFYIDREENFGRVAIALIAEPLLIGERIEMTLDISNSPETGEGMSLFMEDIRGDVPTPAYVTLPPGGSAYFQPFLSVIPLEYRTEWLNNITWWEAESATRPNGGVVEADSSSSGQSRVRFSFTTNSPDMARRLTFNIAPKFAGRWRLFARMGHWIEFPGDGVIDITVKGSGEALSRKNRSLIQGVNGSPFTENRASYLVDLGLYTFPKGNMPVEPGYTLSPSEVGVDIGVTAIGTTYSVWVDYIIAVPIDLPVDARGPASTLNFQDPDRTQGVLFLHIDGENETVQEKFLSGNIGPAANPEVPAGGALMLTPGAKNLFTYLTRRAFRVTDPSKQPHTFLWDRRTRNFVQPRDSLTEQSLVQVSYRPRWLYFSDV